jgi:hypothetical protein
VARQKNKGVVYIKADMSEAEVSRRVDREFDLRYYPDGGYDDRAIHFSLLRGGDPSIVRVLVTQRDKLGNRHVVADHLLEV